MDSPEKAVPLGLAMMRRRAVMVGSGWLAWTALLQPRMAAAQAIPIGRLRGAVHATRAGHEGPLSVADFNNENGRPVAGDGESDDTSGIRAAVQAAAGRKLRFPTGTYRFTSPLALSGVDVEFEGSSLFYDGPPGRFALTLNSVAGIGNTQVNGNTFSDFTLYQQDFAPFAVVTGSDRYEPGRLGPFSALSNITPGGRSTSVSVPGATLGGYARATYDRMPASGGVELTAHVEAPGVVVVTFSNYSNEAIDLLPGLIEVTVINNAYHGLCLGGSLGKLRNAKVRGFTGVSVGFGSGVDITSGVAFSGAERCYYWDADFNVSSAAGWCCIIPPRNNVNEVAITTFPMNAYGDRRANNITQLVIGGVGNTFRRCSLEASSAEETFLLLPGANANGSLGTIYFEANRAFATPPFPRFRAKRFSSGNRFSFRHANGGRAISDEGTANEMVAVPAGFINGQQFEPPSGGRSVVFNGDFEGGLTGWRDLSTGGVFSVRGRGALTGKAARVDLVSGKALLQQDVEQMTEGALAGLNVTAGAWVKTNLRNVRIRVGNATGGSGTVGDGTEEFIAVTYRIPEGASSLPLSITTEGSSATGYLEVSDVTMTVGLVPMALPERTHPTGSRQYEPPIIGPGEQVSTSVPVPGAALGDYVVGSFSADLQGIELAAYVSAPDAVTALFKNGTAQRIKLPRGLVRVLVTKK
jgi:hypothetical protein